MKLIDANKLIEKLSANLDNPEEFPVISLGTVMRMIDGEEEIHISEPEAPCYLGSPCEYQNPNAEIQEERTEKHTKAHACDLVERQAVLDLARDLTFKNIEGLKHYRYRCIDPDHVRELKPVQLTEAIPVAWIEEEIAILKAKGNELAPMLMSAILLSELDNWKERLKNDNS